MYCFLYSLGSALTLGGDSCTCIHLLFSLFLPSVAVQGTKGRVMAVARRHRFLMAPVVALRYTNDAFPFVRREKFR